VSGSSSPRPDASLADALLGARVLLFAAAVPALARLPLARLARLLEPSAVPPHDPERERRTRRVVERVLGAPVPLPRRDCMTRALTRYYFLRRAGADVCLHFGIGMVDGAPAGHCWLSRDGEPLLEPRDPRPLFTETYHVPRDAGLACR
jgi:hypothetical protein